MGEEKLEKRLEEVEVRCDICRKTFALSEEGKKCPECGIGRLWLMEKAT
jgi:Zn finger protein HypA/HybF involved in hydrogenase expression